MNACQISVDTFIKILKYYRERGTTFAVSAVVYIRMENVFIVVTHKILEDRSIESRLEYWKIRPEQASAWLMSRYLCRRGRFSIIALPIGKRMREPDAAGREGEGERKTERESCAVLLDSSERRVCSVLTGRGAHILISTRSPSYYWLEINRPLRG